MYALSYYLTNAGTIFDYISILSQAKHILELVAGDLHIALQTLVDILTYTKGHPFTHISAMRCLLDFTTPDTYFSGDDELGKDGQQDIKTLTKIYNKSINDVIRIIVEKKVFHYLSVIVQPWIKHVSVSNQCVGGMPLRSSVHHNNMATIMPLILHLINSLVLYSSENGAIFRHHLAKGCDITLGVIFPFLRLMILEIISYSNSTIPPEVNKASTYEYDSTNQVGGAKMCIRDSIVLICLAFQTLTLVSFKIKVYNDYFRKNITVVEELLDLMLAMPSDKDNVADMSITKDIYLVEAIVKYLINIDFTKEVNQPSSNSHKKHTAVRHHWYW